MNGRRRRPRNPSTWRETVAVWQTLRHTADSLPVGTTVVIAEDNTAAKKAINSPDNYGELQEIHDLG